MSRTKRFLHNVIASGLLQILTMLAGIVTPKIMLTYYGSEINGLVSSITQFIAYFDLVEAGLSGAVIFSLYSPLAEKNIKVVSGIVTAAKKMYYKIGFVFLVLVILLAAIYPFFITVEDMVYKELFILVIVLGLSGVLDFFVMAKYTTLLTADQKMYVISLANGIQVILTTLLIYVLALCHTNIVVLRATVLIVILLKAGIIVYYAKKQYRTVDYNFSKPDFTALSKRWDVLYLQILTVIQAGTPVVLLTIFVGNLKIVSVYVIYNMVITGVNGILGIFMNGLQAGFGELIVKGENEKLNKAYTDFEFIYYNLIGIVYLVTFITIQPFIQIYTSGVNDVNYNVPVIAFLFVLNALLYNIKTPQGMITLSAGLYKEQRWQITIQGLLAFVIGLIFVSTFGIMGVLAGLIVSNIYRDIEIPFFVSRNIIKKSPRISYLRMGGVIISVMFGYEVFTLYNIVILNYIDWILLVMAAIVYSGLIALLISYVFEKKQMLILISRFCGNK